MIRPPRARGAAFTTAADGDMRHGPRATVSHALGIPSEWATVHQVHGTSIVEVQRPGDAGEGDGLVTTRRAVPLAVFTADCVGMVIEGEGGVAVVHAGWRGMAGGIASRAVERMTEAAMAPARAFVGPMIGSCCFEVGPEVMSQFDPSTHRSTTWGTTSVDLAEAARHQLAGLDVWRAETCTRCGDDAYSHRRDGTSRRMATIAWL